MPEQGFQSSTGPASVGMSSEKKSGPFRIDEAAGNLNAAALDDAVVPSAVGIGIGRVWAAACQPGICWPDA